MLRFKKWCRCCLCALSLLTMSCGAEPDDEAQRIRELIRLGAERAERHDIGGVMDLADDGFLAQPGGRSTEECKRILWWAFKRYGEFRVMYPQPAISLAEKKNRATAKVPFLLLKQDQSFPDLKSLYDDPQGWLEQVGDRGDLYQLSLEFAKRGSDWLVVEATLRGGFQGLELSD